MEVVSEHQPLLKQQRQDLEAPSTTATTWPSPSPSPSPTTSRHSSSDKVSSLDFERIVNQYSIQAVRDEWLLPPRPLDGNPNVRQRPTDKEHTLEQNDRSNNMANTAQMTESENTQKAKPGRRESRHLLGYTGWTAAQWLLTALTGLLTGISTNFIVSCDTRY
jgi:hypothetical protein